MRIPAILVTSCLFLFVGSLVSALGSSYDVPASLVTMRIAFCGMVIYGLSVVLFLIVNRKWIGVLDYHIDYKVTKYLLWMSVATFLWMLIYRGLT